MHSAARARALCALRGAPARHASHGRRRLLHTPGAVAKSPPSQPTAPLPPGARLMGRFLVLPPDPEREGPEEVSKRRTERLCAAPSPSALLAAACDPAHGGVASLDRYNTVAALTTFARLVSEGGGDGSGEPPSASAAAAAGLDALLARAGQLLASDSRADRLVPRAQANVLWALAKLAAAWGDAWAAPQWTPALALKMTTALERTQPQVPQELSNAAWAMAVLGPSRAPPGRFWAAFWSASLCYLPARGAATTGEWAEDAGDDEEGKGAAFSGAPPSRSRSLFVPQALSNVMYAAALAGEAPPQDWGQRWYASVLLLLSDLYPQAVANSVWAVARLSAPALNKPPGGGWGGWGSPADCPQPPLPERLPLGLPPPPAGWLATVAAFAGPRLGLFKPAELGALLSSLAELRHRPPEPWLRRFAQAANPGRALAGAAAGAGGSQALSNVLWAFASLDAHPGDAWVGEWARVAERVMLPPQPGEAAGAGAGAGAAGAWATLQTLSLSVWALGVLREQRRPVFARLAAAVAARLDGAVAAAAAAAAGGGGALPAQPPPAPWAPSSAEAQAARQLYGALLAARLDWAAAGAAADAADAARRGGGAQPPQPPPPPPTKPPPPPPPWPGSAALFAACRAEYLAAVGDGTAAGSRTHTEVLASLASLLPPGSFQSERFCAVAERRVDVAVELPGGLGRVAVEVDGAGHFNQDRSVTGHTVHRNRCLAAAGWRVLPLPWFEWPAEKGAQAAYLAARLRAARDAAGEEAAAAAAAAVQAQAQEEQARRAGAAAGAAAAAAGGGGGGAGAAPPAAATATAVTAAAEDEEAPPPAAAARAVAAAPPVAVRRTVPRVVAGSAPAGPRRVARRAADVG